MEKNVEMTDEKQQKDPQKGRPGGQGKLLTPGERDDVLLGYALLGNQSEVARRTRFTVGTVHRTIEANPERLEELRQAVAEFGRGELAWNFVSINRAIGRTLADAEAAGESPPARAIYELTRSMTLIAQTSRLLDDQPTAIVETTSKTGNVAEMRSRMLQRIESLADGDPKIKRALRRRYERGAAEPITPIEELDDDLEEDNMD